MWHASHLPTLPSGFFRPTEWQEAHAALRTLSGCIASIGIASMDASPSACLPAENWSTCFWWHSAQTFGVGRLAFAASFSVLCSLPWHVSQPTGVGAFACVLSRHCCTTPGCSR